MSWETLLIVVAIVGGVLLIRRWALVSAKDARRYLEAGALIVDVRNPDEFAQAHVPGAINLPLHGLPYSLLSRVPDRKQVLLLHCLGGGRSAVAKRLLRACGYARAYNVGSYGRAQRVARACRRHLPRSQRSSCP